MNTVVVDDFQAVKDPLDVIDLSISYATLLARSSPADQINTSAWALSADSPAGLTIDSDSVQSNNIAVVWISAGGALQVKHKLVNHIVTVGGREYDRTITVTMQDK